MVPLAGLTPSVANLVAQRAYEKAGFRRLRAYEAPGLGRGVLMVMRLGLNSVSFRMDRL